MESFLAHAGWGEAVVAPLAGDASFRRYYRLRLGESRAVLMDAPPPQEDVRPFVRVAKYLLSYGYSAPAILAQDEENGFLLLEDLGDDLFARVLAGSAAADDVSEAALYRCATELLIDLHLRPLMLELPAYSDALFCEELALFAQWAPEAEKAGSAALAEELAALFRPLLLRAWQVPGGLVLRDYHAENLLWLPEREGIYRVGLLDFQDAVHGPVTYDLVSLLEDARRDVPPEVAQSCHAHYLAAFPELDPDAFAASCAILGAQRNLKIIGIFHRLHRRDGKPRYLDYLPRVWAHLRRNLSHPALAEVRMYLSEKGVMEG